LKIPINRIELDTILHELYINNYTQEKYLNAGDLREIIFE